MNKWSDVTIVKKGDKYYLHVENGINLTYQWVEVKDYNPNGGTFNTVVEENTLLSYNKEGIYVLSMRTADIPGAAERVEYVVIMPTFFKCKEHLLEMITCGNNKCVPRHDCSNCDGVYQKYSQMLSEVLIYSEKLKSVCDRHLFITDKEKEVVADLNERLSTIAEKITSLTKSCQACIPCVGNHVTDKVVKSTGCIPCQKKNKR
jgi:hypothetical protein